MQTPEIPRPDFHSELPADRAMPRYQMIRTPAKKKVAFLCLSETALIMPTHFVRKRTMPCFQPRPCTECGMGTEVRWKLYVAVFTPSTGVINILELTDHGGEALKNYEHQVGSLRGKKIIAWREGVKENSPVFTSVGPVLDSSIVVPPCPDVKEFLYRMWYVKNNRATDGEATTARVNRVSEVLDEIKQPLIATNGRVKRQNKRS